MDKKLKIKTFGARGITCQVNRIDSALLSLGHEFTDENSDLIYSNDPGGFDAAIKHKQKFGGKLILNILDVPIHIGAGFGDWINEVKEKLEYADAVATISKYTKKQVKGILGFDSTVIYNPIQDVYYDKNNKEKKWFACTSSRVNDPNKRFNLTKEYISFTSNQNNIPISELITVAGMENPNFGNFEGIVSPQRLSEIYNQSIFCFCLSKIEGISLNVIEAIEGDCIPVVARDMTTAKELVPEEFLCDPSLESIKEKVTDMWNNIDWYHKQLSELRKFHGNKFRKEEVARKILSVYNSLT